MGGIEEPDQRVAPRWLGPAIVSLVLVAVAAAIAFVFWPGHMDPDTFTEYDQALSGHYTDWHTPVLSSLWRIGISIGFTSPGWVLFGAAATFLFGGYLCLRIVLSRWASTVAIVLIALSPQVLGYLVHVGKDNWMTCLLLMTFGTIGKVAAAPRARRWSWVALALVSAFLLAGARLNALPALLVAMVTLALVLLGVSRRDDPPRQWTLRVPAWRGVLAAVAAGAVVALAIAGAVRVTTYQVLGAERKHPEQMLYLFDLLALSKRERVVLVPPSIFPSQDLGLIDRLVTDASADFLVYGPTGTVLLPIEGDRLTKLRQAWIDAIRDHPKGYLAVRAKRWLEQASVTAWSWEAYHPGILPDPAVFGLDRPEMQRLHIERPGLHDAATTYLQWFTTYIHLEGGVVHVVIAYQMMLVGGVVVMWRTRRVRARALAGLFLAAGLYELSFFFLAPTTFYRDSYCTVVVGLVAAVTSLAELQKARARRSTATRAALDEPSGQAGLVASSTSD